MEADEYRRMAAAEESHWWYRSTRGLLRQLVEPLLSHDVGALQLDAAGGTGATGAWLSEHAATVLADYEPLALEIAREVHPRYLPVRADLNSLPFPAGAFSAIVCVTALYHRMNPDPGSVVADFARLTRPGGIVVLMEPGGKRLWRGHDEVTHGARRFSLAEMRAMAVDAGLDVVVATGAYSFLVPPAFVMGRLERASDKSDVDRNQSGMGGLFGRLAAIERRVIRRRSLPFGLSVIVVARKPAA
ncbi:MAG: Methyltransferase type 11 [Acidimicrobiales bacterium]|nr:Methyltransferase type 11 [Acidimicrobiales bacterium]